MQKKEREKRAPAHLFARVLIKKYVDSKLGQEDAIRGVSAHSLFKICQSCSVTTEYFDRTIGYALN
jgi:hypothetical protein